MLVRVLLWVVLLVLPAVAANAAGAQTYPITPPTVESEEETPNDPGNDIGEDPSDDAHAVLDDVVTRRSGTLPVTGGDILGLTAIAVAAIAVGSVMVSRRRRTS